MWLSTGWSRRGIFVALSAVAVVVLQSNIAYAAVGDDDPSTQDVNQRNDDPPEGEEYFAPVPAEVEICKSLLCVRKCCKEGEHFDEDYECATSNNSQWRPAIFLKNWKDADPSKLEVVVGLPPFCPEEEIILTEDSFHLLPNGRLQSQTDNWTEPSSSYCLEYIEGDDMIQALHCVGPEEEELECEFANILYPVLMSFSCFFLLVTFVVYVGVPTLRQRTYGRCLISLVIALLIFYLTQISNFFNTVHVHQQCIALAFFMHWNGLAIFFWLNIMAFELWRTVRAQTPVEHSMTKFMKYSAYAWGCPLLIAIITVIIDHLPEEYDLIVRPQLAGSHCFLEGDMERWIYLNWVILAVTLVNLGFFIDICIRIHKAQTMVDKRSNNFWLFLKMFLIMGIAWVLELFSTRHCLWVIGDLPNLLQGVGIFIATVCNRQVLKEVLDCLPPWFGSLRQKISTSSGSDPSTKASSNQPGLIGNSSADYGIHQDNMDSVPLTDMHANK